MSVERLLIRAQKAEHNGQFAEALKLYTMLQTDATDAQSKFEYMVAIANCQLRLSDFSNSLESGYAALDLSRALGKMERAIALNRIAAVYAGLGDIEMAFEYSKLAWGLMGKSPWSREKGIVAISLSAVYLLLGDHKNALKFAKLTYDHRKIVAHPETVIRSMLYLSTAEMDRNFLNRSTRWAERALELSQRIQQPFYTAKSYHALGRTSLKAGRNQEAIQQFRDAGELFRSAGDLLSAISSIELMSYALEKSGQLTEAIQQLRTVLNHSVQLQTEQRATIRKELNAEQSAVRRKLQSVEANLSLAEVRISEMIHRGLDTKQIAQELNISTKTVERHRANIRKKLNLKGKGSLAGALMKL